MPRPMATTQVLEIFNLSRVVTLRVFLRVLHAGLAEEPPATQLYPEYNA